MTATDGGPSALPKPPVGRRWTLAATGIAFAIAAFGVLGIRYLSAPQGLRRFDLDQEGTVPAAFSALLLGFGGLAVLALYRLLLVKRLTLLLAPTLIYMAFDEVFSFHENLETSTGINSAFWLAPVALLGACGWWGALQSWRTMVWPRAMFVAGAVAWFVSQVFELVGHSVLFYGDTREQAPNYGFWMVTEELLEMSGSALFLLAMLYVLNARDEQERPLRDALRKPRTASTEGTG